MSFIIASVSFITGSLYFYRKSQFSIKSFFVFIILFLITILLDSLYVISDYFTGDGITDGTLYHIQYGLQGSGFLEYRGLIVGLMGFIFVALMFLWLVVSKKRFDGGKEVDHFRLTIFLMGISLFLNPAIPDLYHLLDTSQQRDGMSTEDYYKQYEFSDFYKKPILKKIGEQKNFVFIYAESFEQTYSNENNFPGLTPGLDALSKRAVSFTDLRQLKGTGYTIAGFVASQCGIPLVGPTFGNAMSGMDSYLPSISCLGDALSDEGYTLVDYGGEDASFAGRDLFLKQHGFKEVYGKKELLPRLQDSSYVTNWGLYDDSLFEVVYDDFLRLSDQDTSFGLFLSTLDTHQPNGHLSKSCEGIRYKDGSDLVLNGIACSDRLIAKFVRDILASPDGKNTVVIIASDHLAPHNPSEKSEGDMMRSNRLMIISPDDMQPVEVTVLGSTLDTGATLLPFIGYQSYGIGLGRNLLDPWQSEFERKIIQSHIFQWREPLSVFWNFPTITDGIKINTEENSLDIDGRKFKVPALVRISQDFQTKLDFQFGIEFSSKKEDKDLISQAQKIDSWTSFILIHTCGEARKMKSDLKTDAEFCLVAGRGKEYSVSPILDSLQILTKEDVIRLTGLK